MAGPTKRPETREIRSALTRRIREIYVTHCRRYIEERTGVPSRYGERAMPKWDGGVAADGKKYTSVWMRLARFVVEHQVDPATLIRATFTAWIEETDSQNPPTPLMVMRESSLQRARTLRGDLEADAQRQLAIQRESFRIGVIVTADRYSITADQATGRILRDTSRELSALFRYCMAVAKGYPDIAELYREDAFRHYAFNADAYDSVWGDVVPDDFRTDVAALRRLLKRVGA